MSYVLHYLAIVMFIGGFLNLIPLFAGWTYSAEGGDKPLDTARQSSAFLLSLIISISITGTITVDFIVSIICSPGISAVTKGWRIRAVMLVALLLPNIIAMIAIYRQDSVLIISIYRIRTELIVFALMAHLWEFGPSVFRCNLLLCSATLSMLGIAFTFLEISDNIHPYIPLFIYMSCEGAGFILFSYLVFKYLIDVKRKSFSNMSIADHICNIYILCYLLLVGLIVVILVVTRDVAGQNLSTIPLVAATYGLTLYALLIFILQNRITNAEVIRHQHSLDMKRMFVRYVSHEIRTPLNTVFVGLDVLKSELEMSKEDVMLTKTIDELHMSCDIALDILNDMLNYDKLEAGLMLLDKSVVKASEFLDSSISPFGIQARLTGVVLQLSDFHNDLNGVYFEIDRGKLSQVMRNFLSNALKFTSNGGVISITARMGNDQDTDIGRRRRVLRVEVRDTGAGIAEENLSKVFHEIIQFSPGKLQNGGGSGLGLWISKQIVELHGGSVSVSSEGEGKGSIFAFCIPVDEPSFSLELNSSSTGSNQLQSADNEENRDISSPHFLALSNQVNTVHEENEPDESNIAETSSIIVDDCNVPNKEAKSSNEIIRTENLSCSANESDEGIRLLTRILCVDDSGATRKMMCRGLQCKGYQQIEQAENGLEGVKLMETAMSSKKIFHVILMDYQMPVMDGPTATKLIRDLGYKGQIIGVTGNALPDDIQFFTSQGADFVLTKPVGMNKLDACIIDAFKYFCALEQ